MLIAVLNFPFAITLSGPYLMMSDLTAASGGGPRLAISILCLVIVILQTIAMLGAGSFGLAALFGFGAADFAVWKLPKMSGIMHTQRVCNEWAAQSN